MNIFENLTVNFVKQSQEILGENLVGIYLHGSAVMGCFNEKKSDIENAEEEITVNPTYIILNLCRVLAYKKDELILSKLEGGNWGIDNVPKKYHCLIFGALDEYLSDKSMEWDENCARGNASYMIEQIKK